GRNWYNAAQTADDQARCQDAGRRRGWRWRTGRFEIVGIVAVAFSRPADQTAVVHLPPQQAGFAVRPIEDAELAARRDTRNDLAEEGRLCAQAVGQARIRRDPPDAANRQPGWLRADCGGLGVARAGGPADDQCQHDCKYHDEY